MASNGRDTAQRYTKFTACFVSLEKSLVVYQSRTVWMNNLLTKLGILSTKDEVQENEDKRSPSPEEQQSVFDDQKEWDTYIKGLDPKDWKDQDHYRILGLSKRRIDSTESEIKKACKFFSPLICVFI